MARLGDLRIGVFRGLAGLDALADDWRVLFARLERPSYLQLWEWHRSYLEAGLFDPERVFFCAVYDGDRLAAVLPLVRKIKRVLGVPLRLLTLPYHELMPHADIIAEPRVLTRFDLPAMLRALRGELQGSWDAVGFGRALEDSAAGVLMHRLQGRRDGLLVTTQQVESSCALEIAPYGDMLARFSKNFRKSLRKARDQLAKRESIEVRWARRPDELAQAFPLFLAVEASGWKGKAGTAIQSDPLLYGLFSGLVKHLGPSGRCRVNLLMQGDQVLAGQFALVAGDRLYLLKTGYDESYSKLSPSNIMIERLLQKLAEEPDIRFLDLVADQDWHQAWRPVRRRVLMHYLCRPAPRGAIIWAAMRRRPVALTTVGDSSANSDG